jgi:hypothetical protein
MTRNGRLLTDAECVEMWRQLEAVVATHVRYFTRNPEGMSVGVIEVEGDYDDGPIIRVAGVRQPWGYPHGEGTTLAAALRSALDDPDRTARRAAARAETPQ